MKEKSMKRYLGILLCLLLLPFTVNAKEKVKVYMFEAGGCPYCEQEESYLKGLDSYNEKFTLEKKELYEDHVLWKPGKDFYLGVKVANAFKAYDGTKFKDATYQGTPFVVISDLYAAAAYNPDLEGIIDEAYQNGDKDIVSCIADDQNDCLEGYDAKAATEEADEAYETAMAYYNYNLEQQGGGSTNTNTSYRGSGKLELSQNAILILVITIIVIFIAMLIVVNVQINRKVKEAETKEDKKIKAEPEAETKSVEVKKVSPAKPKTTTKKTTKPAAKKTTTAKTPTKPKTTSKKKTTTKTTK